LAAFAHFRSVTGAAENTTLADHSVDLLTSAQAAHWFDRDKAVREFQRILKPGGFLVLLWNDRRIEASAFGRDYEQLLLEYGTDYEEVRKRDQASAGFFGEIKSEKRVLNNYQDLDYAALEGRLLSSSYIPQPGDAAYVPMLAELRRVFDAHQQEGLVRMDYDTKIYFGKLSPIE
jgi:SAM-dependent methyltransferase